MSYVIIPFNIPDNPDFRFELKLESKSVESHSLLDSGETKEDMKKIMESQVRDSRFMTTLERHCVRWKESKR